MPKQTSTYVQIVEAADALFYERGFDGASFADIAAVVNISRGNFYYHFNTKDDLLGAVIDQRLARTDAMLQDWNKEADPATRIRSFIHMLIENRSPIMRSGCPVGTLCGELAKLNHPRLPQANKLFGLFREWLARQFSALGRAADADDLAIHLLVRSQGVAILLNALQDEDVLQREVDAMGVWLDAQIPAPTL